MTTTRNYPILSKYIIIYPGAVSEIPALMQTTLSVMMSRKGHQQAWSGGETGFWLGIEGYLSYTYLYGDMVLAGVYIYICAHTHTHTIVGWSHLVNWLDDADVKPTVNPSHRKLLSKATHLFSDLRKRLVSTTFPGL